MSTEIPGECIADLMVVEGVDKIGSSPSARRERIMPVAARNSKRSWSLHIWPMQGKP